MENPKVNQPSGQKNEEWLENYRRENEEYKPTLGLAEIFSKGEHKFPVREGVEDEVHHEPSKARLKALKTVFKDRTTETTEDKKKPPVTAEFRSSGTELKARLFQAYIILKASGNDAALLERFKSANGFDGFSTDPLKEIKGDKAIEAVKTKLAGLGVKSTASLDTLIEGIVLKKGEIDQNLAQVTSSTSHEIDKYYKFKAAQENSEFDPVKFHKAAERFNNKNFNSNFKRHTISPSEIFDLAVTASILAGKEKGVPGGKAEIENLYEKGADSAEPYGKLKTDFINNFSYEFINVAQTKLEKIEPNPKTHVTMLGITAKKGFVGKIINDFTNLFSSPDPKKDFFNR